MVENPTKATKDVKDDVLNLEVIGRGANSIIGITPILLDEDGNPSGVPVQFSKNWHTTQGVSTVYDGNWFSASMVLRVARGATLTMTLQYTYTDYGGLPSVSHAQLSLIGMRREPFNFTPMAVNSISPGSPRVPHGAYVW